MKWDMTHLYVGHDLGIRGKYSIYVCDISTVFLFGSEPIVK